jgi:hypothetical protein
MRADCGPGRSAHPTTAPANPRPALASRPSGRSVKKIGQLLGNGKAVSRQTVYRALGVLAT